MPLMKRAEDYRLSSIYGHVIHFKANEPTMVPKRLVGSAKACGATVVDAEEEPKIEPEAPNKKEIRAEAPVGEEREKAILAIFEELLIANNSDDFTPGAKPKASVVSKRVKFEVDKNEIARLWTPFIADFKSGGK